MRPCKRPRRNPCDSDATSSSVINLHVSSSEASRKTCIAPDGVESAVEVIDLCSTARPQRRENCKENARPADSPRRRKHRNAKPMDGQGDAIAPYLKSIDVHLMITESVHRSRAGFMLRQADVNIKMRGILIDWLVDVHVKFKLVSETLHLAVNLLDRYLEKENVTRRKLQLVGCAALFLASKYEEVMPPEARDFVYVSDKAFSRKQLLQMEGKMLFTLGFNLTTPSSLLFLQRFLAVGGFSSHHELLCHGSCRTELLARYMLELALPHCHMHQHAPSLLAAAALSLAREAMGEAPWPEVLEEHTKYSAADLAVCSLDLRELHREAPQAHMQAVRRKYAQDRFGAVSGIPL